MAAATDCSAAAHLASKESDMEWERVVAATRGSGSAPAAC